ncbi:hypothetical protein Taro_034839 [Colocasia esculenta]|uniref:Aminotransferase-like plant mobile domain-containing protein n=1 Tax=Colocasia esculenta TaxID=4460 RepID=A0A843W518_COLES|nr:hypothetical protein [Colocasia esculenta]
MTPIEEEEIKDVAMELEEEPEVPVMTIEEARKKKRKAMKSRDRIEEMGFGEIFRMDRMRPDPALTQELRSRWDTEATAFVFPWGHMIPSLEDVGRITGLRVYGRPVSGFTYPCYHDIAERLLELPVERRSSIVPRRTLQESLGLYDVARQTGDDADEHMEQLVRSSQSELASEPGAQADLDLRPVYGGELRLGSGVSGAPVRQPGCLGAADFYERLLLLPSGLGLSHLPTLGRGVLERPGLVPIACRWDSRRDSHSLGDQLERLQEAIDSYPYLDPYLGEGDEGQPWLVQARPYFGRPVWLHALNLVLPLHLYISQRSLGLRQSVVEFPARDRFRRPGRCSWRDCITPSLTLLGGARSRRELERVRSTGAGGASSSRGAGGSPSLLEAQLAGAVLRAEEAQRHLEEREMDLRLTTEHAMYLQGQRDQLQGEIQTTQRERDQLRIRAEAAKARVAEATKELAALRVQGPPADQAEMVRLRTEVMAQQIRIDELRGMVKTLGEAARSRSRSRSRTGVSGASGASIRQYLAGSSSRWRNKEDERRHRGEGSAQGDSDGGEMPPPADRHEGSGESGGGQ